MKMQLFGKIVAMCALAGAAAAAQAATYSLTCETAKGEKFTVALTSFSFHVGSSTEANTGMAAGSKRATSELIIRFATNSGTYETLLTAAEDDEVLRSCRLSEGAGGGTTAADNWNSDVKAKGKNKKSVDSGSARGGSATSSNGAMEWVLNNATVSGVTAMQTDGTGTAGTPESVIQATIVAQNFTFAP
jgi:hypothetical protein